MIKFFKDKKNVLAVMSERSDGSMKLLKSNINKENRSNFFRKININENNAVSAEIVHGNKVTVVKKNHPTIIKGADALVTKENIFLAVTVADCIPVYFYDEENRIMGLAHAGWQGINKGIIKNILDKMIKLGGNQDNIRVALGPGIKKCHFEIRDDAVDKFKKYPQFINFKKEKIFVDLFGIIKSQLSEYKIKNRNIFVSKDCTVEDSKKYFSYRRDKPKEVEAMIAIIGMK